MTLCFLITTLLCTPEMRLEELSSHYDLEGAKALNTDLSADAALCVSLLRAKAVLLIAELHRYEWERLPENERTARREKGALIDEYATQGLDIAKNLPASSEKHRVMADLYGLMIRSDYRARRYRKRMEEAAESSRQLDPNNARIYVTLAKPYLFANTHQGRDLAKAKSLLERALKLDPELEQALLLTAYAEKELGNNALHIKILKEIMEKNPNCRPARDQLRDVHPDIGQMKVSRVCVRFVGFS